MADMFLSERTLYVMPYGVETDCAANVHTLVSRMFQILTKVSLLKCLNISFSLHLCHYSVFYVILHRTPWPNDWDVEVLLLNDAYLHSVSFLLYTNWCYYLFCSKRCRPQCFSWWAWWKVAGKLRQAARIFRNTSTRSWRRYSSRWEILPVKSKSESDVWDSSKKPDRMEPFRMYTFL